jgi:hypothetical protein
MWEKFTSASMCLMGVTIPGVPGGVKFTSASMCLMGVTIPGVLSSVKPLQLRVGDVGEVHKGFHMLDGRDHTWRPRPCEAPPAAG